MKECCGYGTDGKKETGYDCVIIPRASKQATADKLVGGSEFCGRALADASMGAAGGPATVCSKYLINFKKRSVYEWSTFAKIHSNFNR